MPDPSATREVRLVTEESLPRVRAFLEVHVETSLFLLSNMATEGLRLGDGTHSGNVKYIQEDGGVVAAFCLTRRGGLVAQTGGRTDVAADILAACASETIRITSVVNEWRIAQALWGLLCAEPSFHVQYTSKEVLYRLPLAAALALSPARSEQVLVRALVPDDFVEWDGTNRMFLAEQGIPIASPPEQRRVNFMNLASAGRAWGAVKDGKLSCTALLSAVHGSRGLVGGMFTVPELRRQGLARAVMSFLITHGAPELGLDTLLLFTGEENVRARALYESLGFAAAGHFGLFFGSLSNGDAQPLLALKAR